MGEVKRIAEVTPSPEVKAATVQLDGPRPPRQACASSQTSAAGPAQAGDVLVHVDVVNIAGDTLARLDWRPEATVGGLKCHLQELRGVSMSAQRIVHDFSALADTTQLGSLGTGRISLTMVVMSYSAEMSAALLNFAEEGDVRAAALALRGQADPDCTDVDGWSPLHLAALNGHAGIVRLLCEACADKNRTAADGERAAPLHMAAWSGCTEIVRQLCAARADVNRKQGNQWTALHIASRNGDLEVVRLLCQAGADRQIRGCFGGKAVHVAILHGHLRVVRRLLLLDDAEDDARLPIYRLVALVLVAFQEAVRVAVHLAQRVRCGRRRQLQRSPGGQ